MFYVINTDLNLDGIHKNALKRPPTPEQKEEYNQQMQEWSKSENKGPQPELDTGCYEPCEVFTNYVHAAMVNVHQHAPKVTLFKCAKIDRKLDEACASESKEVILTKDEFGFIRRCIDKCQWNNNPNNAILLERIDQALSKAKEQPKDG